MRARNLLLVSILVAVGALAVVAFVMQGGDRERNDALLFLDRFGNLDVDDPPEERTAIIEDLTAIPFASPDIDRVRDVCVEAHGTLLVAEERGVAARTAFDLATDRGRIRESDIPTETRASIEAALTESNDALARVRTLMSDCDDRVRGLRTRFRTRRPSQR